MNLYERIQKDQAFRERNLDIINRATDVIGKHPVILDELSYKLYAVFEIISNTQVKQVTEAMANGWHYRPAIDKNVHWSSWRISMRLAKDMREEENRNVFVGNAISREAGTVIEI